MKGAKGGTLDQTAPASELLAMRELKTLLDTLIPLQRSARREGMVMRAYYLLGLLEMKQEMGVAWPKIRTALKGKS